MTRTICCTGCGAESILPGETLAGIADWFCSQACYERHRDARREPAPLGRVLPFTKPAKPLERSSER